jgi:uncharacterized protein YceK
MADVYVRISSHKHGQDKDITRCRLIKMCGGCGEIRSCTLAQPAVPTTRQGLGTWIREQPSWLTWNTNSVGLCIKHVDKAWRDATWASVIRRRHKKQSDTP